MKMYLGARGRNQQSATRAEGFRVAVAVSLALHALLLALPHPALWFSLPSIAKHDPAPQKVMSVRFAAWASLDEASGTMRSAAVPADPPPFPQDASEAKTSSLGNFHFSHDLTRQPELIGSPMKDFWLPYNLSGKALFRLVIDSKGTARHVSVLRSTLPRDIEGDAARRLYTAQYRPGEVKGMPVSAEMFVEMQLDVAQNDEITIP